MGHTRRKTDPPGSRTHFRSQRLLQDGDRWFFCTREGTLEGPYEDRIGAQHALDTYLSIMRLDLLDNTAPLSLVEEH